MKHLILLPELVILWFLLFLQALPAAISFQHHSFRSVHNSKVVQSQHGLFLTSSRNTMVIQMTTKHTFTKLREHSTSKDEAVANTGKSNKIDKVLYKLTSQFPFFVMSAAIMGTYRPSTLNWLNRGPTITIMLASVMIGMGMTLSKKDFDMVFQSDQIKSVPMGVMCQFGIMPLAAYFIGKYVMKLNIINPSLYLGLILVGSAPGGTASNLVSLIANADVALSVVLTSCSTILASVVTPMLVKLLSSAGEASIGSHAVVSISGWALCAATAKVVLGPILIGMGLNSNAPKLCQWISRFTPFASVLLVSLICGGVVAENAASMAMTVGASFLNIALFSVFLLHCIGFVAGFIIPRYAFRCDERTSRTVSIETGMQNSALACVLAKSISGDPLMSLPGALSATMHSCLGSILAAYWRARDDNKNSKL